MQHLSPLIITFGVFGALFGSALLGLRLRGRLPENHLSRETKEAVRLGMGSVATMAALVLGLLVASTKGAYDTERGEVIQMASKVIWLDRLLENYGPDAGECRDLLRQAVHSALFRIWPDSTMERRERALDPGSLWSRELPVAIQRLNAGSDAQRTFKTQAAAAASDLGQMRWLLFEQAESSLSPPLMAIMVFWMALTYASIGLFAPPNGTVVCAQLLAALAVAGALFLILELDDPFSGLVRISPAPMENALKHLTR